MPMTSSPWAAAPAGTAARRGRPTSALKVARVERRKVGGTCLHRGCIPAVALLQARGGQVAADAGSYGVRATFEGDPMVPVDDDGSPG